MNIAARPDAADTNNLYRRVLKLITVEQLKSIRLQRSPILFNVVPDDFITNSGLCPQITACVSPLLAILTESLLVSPLDVTLTGWGSPREQSRVTVPHARCARKAPVGKPATTPLRYFPVSCSSTASDSISPCSMANFVPSSEYATRMIWSFVKWVNW
jgi:hypothetical protein